MSIPFNKIQVRVDLSRLVGNYRLLSERAASVAPVVKADAYGHGLERVAPALWEAGARTFAVGTVQEAAFLRPILPEARIISLLGPLDPEDYPLVWEHGLVPFVSRPDQLGLLSAASPAGDRKLAIALKFDTGMSRLGFSETDVPALVAALADNPRLEAVLAASHLATADEPGNTAYVREQGERFGRIVQDLRAAGLSIEATLANSGGILAHQGLHHDLVRGGIALYGINPFQATELEELGHGLRPAMEVTAPVTAVRRLAAGQSISYGCTFTAPRDMTVAIVAAGYADAYSRSLTNKGAMCVRGRRAPIVGRVCMQLTAVDVSALPEPPAPGERVHLLGGEGAGAITPDDLAGWWGTITYEVFCLLGLNPREYI